MPVYEYECLFCKENEKEILLEIKQKVSDPPPVCKECKNTMTKRIVGSSFQLKGSGWYKDGY